jgi:hypothetical protein
MASLPASVPQNAEGSVAIIIYTLSRPVEFIASSAQGCLWSSNSQPGSALRVRVPPGYRKQGSRLFMVVQLTARLCAPCTSPSRLSQAGLKAVYGRPIHSLALRSVYESLQVIASRAQGCLWSSNSQPGSALRARVPPGYRKQGSGLFMVVQFTAWLCAPCTSPSRLSQAALRAVGPIHYE